MATVSPQFLTDPFLQDPTPDSVRVVWFTEFEGGNHQVRWGSPGASHDGIFPHQANAMTRRLSRTREDAGSRIDHPDFADLKRTVPRPIWRHEALVAGLLPGQRVPYRVTSMADDRSTITSRVFTLAGSPEPGQPLRILLTSDHQNMPMVAANLQKVADTVGRVDAVFSAGDLVNVPDRASEWFDDSRGGAFFPCLQGRAGTGEFRGGAIIQHAPLFLAVGNHEVMGRFASEGPLNDQFNDPVPRSVAEELYEARRDRLNPRGDPALRRQWVNDHSFNTKTFDELFSQPTPADRDRDHPETGPRYYATTFGDIRLISLDVAQIWRHYLLDPGTRGRYQERAADLGIPRNWGHGQHIFEPIEQGSPQYRWLQQELSGDAFRNARYKVVMMHHPPHSLGNNIVPPFTTPRPHYDRNDQGELTAIRYRYPRAADHIIRDLVPLLEQAGVDLVHYGHCHLWNRFRSLRGTHYLETSNVGNSYGAFWNEDVRPVPPESIDGSTVAYGSSDYIAQGDPNGLEPVVPTIAPLLDDRGQSLPYIANNDITAFSVFETDTGTVDSYYFDTRQPDSAVVKFDEFRLGS